MSYISTYHRGDTVYVWERENLHGRRKLVEYEAPYYFYVKNEQGEYMSLFNEPLIKLEFDTRDDMNKARSELIRSGHLLYESDISAELKVLSMNYYNKLPPPLHVMFLDIEVDYDPKIGFSSVANPYAPINAIAYYSNKRDLHKVLAVPPPGFKMPSMEQFLKDVASYAPLPDNFELKIVRNERELLQIFLDDLEEADLVSGWNSNFFDIPYITKRVELTLGKVSVKRLCFDSVAAPRFREVEVFGNKQICADLVGRVHLDYMDLFKKYEMAMRPSYKLEAIAEEFLPNLPKLSFDSTLYELYRNHFAHFVRYNVRDTEILHGLDGKLGYIGVANTMCHTSTAHFRDVLGTVRLTDLAMVNHCHYHENKIVPDWTEKPDGSIQGAYVLFPQIGLHSRIGSIDINSLYPSAERSLNISPETIIGQFDLNIEACEQIAANTDLPLTLRYEDGSEETMTASEWREYLWSKKWAVSGYGTVFDQNFQGIIPTILSTWFAQRKEYQKMKNEAYAKREALLAKYGVKK